jgi:hypothetical protein
MFALLSSAYLFIVGLGIFIWFFGGFFILAGYIFACICWMKVGEKLNHPYPWTAWFAHNVLLVQLADVPWWWLFFMFIPIVNLVFSIIIYIKILEKLDRPTWWCIWFILFWPIVYLVIVGIIGLSETSSSGYRDRDFGGDFDNYNKQPANNFQDDETVNLGVRSPGFGVLIVEHGSNKGQSYKLAPNSTNVIGRAGNIQLPINDRSASREHARIRDENGKFVIYDLGSTNKTVIGGQKIDRKVLMNGDVIKTGQTVFRFQWFRK